LKSEYQTTIAKPERARLYYFSVPCGEGRKFSGETRSPHQICARAAAHTRKTHLTQTSKHMQ